MGGFGFSVIVASITAQLSNLNKSAAKRQCAPAHRGARGRRIKHTAARRCAGSGLTR